MKTTKFSLLLPILILLSCSTPSQYDTDEFLEKGDEIFPLKVGNFWEYDDFEYENDSLIATRHIKIEVIDKINILWEGIQIFISQKESVCYKTSQKEVTDIIERKF